MTKSGVQGRWPVRRRRPGGATQSSHAAAGARLDRVLRGHDGPQRAEELSALEAHHPLVQPALPLFAGMLSVTHRQQSGLRARLRQIQAVHLARISWEQAERGQNASGVRSDVSRSLFFCRSQAESGTRPQRGTARRRLYLLFIGFSDFDDTSGWARRFQVASAGCDKPAKRPTYSPFTAQPSACEHLSDFPGAYVKRASDKVGGGAPELGPGAWKWLTGEGSAPAATRGRRRSRVFVALLLLRSHVSSRARRVRCTRLRQPGVQKRWTHHRGETLGWRPAFRIPTAAPPAGIFLC